MTYAVVYFSLNNSEFTEKYCENKEKPILKCNGKCKLAKLAKETEKSASNKSVSIERDTVLFFQPIENIEFIVHNLLKKEVKTKFDSYHYIAPFYSFHPPNFCFLFS
jgi:hypothetical protein